VSGAGAPSLDIDGRGYTVEIIASSWHDAVMDGLIGGATKACENAGAQYRLTRVPGCFELPVVAESLARFWESKGRPQGLAIVALGVIIRGGTPHFEFIADATTRGLTDVARNHEVPVGFGVLTCDTEKQALERAGLPDSKESKGKEAVEAALATARVIANLS
jgi:6,7-dimethyl-8-ribityllumazine synthase